MKHRRSSSTFNYAWIVVVGFLPLLAAFLLIPRDLEMAERLADDGHPGRALDLLAELIPREVDQDIVARNGEWVFPAMEVLLNEDNSMVSKRTRMLRILVKVTEKPGDAFRLLSSQSEQLLPEAAEEFLRILARTALRQNNPELASEIYHFLSDHYGIGEELMMEAFQAHRYSGSPRLALDLMYAYAETKGLPVSALPQKHRMLLIDLHRELNEGKKAFALLREEFDRADSREEKQSLIELLLTTASQSNLFSESLPLLRDLVDKTQAAQMSWRALAARQVPHDSDTMFLKYGTTLAQQLLWSGQLHPAFDMYRKLALLDHEDSLDKCVEMTPWVNRAHELGELLGAIDPLPGGKGYEKLYIESLSAGGEFEKAEKAVRKWLEKGESRELDWMRLTLADLVFEQRRYGEAQILYGQALKESRQGDDSGRWVANVVRMARAVSIAGDYPEAVKLYRKIPAESHSVKTIEDYQYLAYSLNSMQDILRGLLIRSEKEPFRSESQTWLSLADACEQAGRLTEAIAYLEKGRAACPDSRKIILKMVDLLVLQGKRLDALEYLLGSYLSKDFRFCSKLLSLAVATNRQEQVLEFLALEDNVASSWAPSLRLLLAELYESIDDLRLALAIYEDFDGNEVEAPMLRLQARVDYDNGDFADARERFMRYLEVNPSPEYHDLIFMGDLHRYNGKTSDAMLSYNAALMKLNQGNKMEAL